MLAGAVWCLGYIATITCRNILPNRIRKPLLVSGGRSVFLLCWTSLIMVSFYFLVPAPSFFSKRLILAILVPASLLGISCLVALTRMSFGRASVLAAPCILFLLLPYKHQLGTWEERLELRRDNFAPYETISQIDLQGNSRLYATPSEHLALTFYTGLPVQSIAPIRREFLDAYKGKIILIDQSRHSYSVIIRLESS